MQPSLKQIIGICIIMCSSIVVGQKTITVNNTPGTAADYTSIQAAVNAASQGDYIYVQHSKTPYGDVEVNKEVHLRGRSHSLEGYVTKAGVFKFLSESGEASLQGFKCGINADENTKTSKSVKVKNNYLLLTTNDSSLYEAKNIIIEGNIVQTPATISTILFSSRAQNIGFRHNICINDVYIERCIGMMDISNNIFAGASTHFGTENDLMGIKNCIFIGNTNFSSKVTSFVSGNGKITFTNCVAYNYNQNSTYIFEKDEENPDSVELVNCLDNTNPEFVTINFKGKSVVAELDDDREYTTAEDFHLKNNAPVKSAGVYGN